MQLDLTGPNDSWFALGLGGRDMQGTYAVIVHTVRGSIQVEERLLQRESAGKLLGPSVSYETQRSARGDQLVSLRRTLRPPTRDHYGLSTALDAVDVIAARGASNARLFSESTTHGPKGRVAATIILGEAPQEQLFAGAPLAAAMTPAERHADEVDRAFLESPRYRHAARSPPLGPLPTSVPPSPVPVAAPPGPTGGLSGQGAVAVALLVILVVAFAGAAAAVLQRRSSRAAAARPRPSAFAEPTPHSPECQLLQQSPQAGSAS